MRKFILSFFILFFYAITNIYGLGIASDFLPNYTMELTKGQSVIYGVRLQNPEDKEQVVMFLLNSEIAEVIDYKKQYVLPPKSSAPISINITIPNKINVGYVYTVGYELVPVTTGGGPVPLNINLKGSFKVRVTKNQKLTKILMNIYKVLFVTILLIIIYGVIRKPKKSKKSGKR